MSCFYGYVFLLCINVAYKTYFTLTFYQRFHWQIRVLWRRDHQSIIRQASRSVGFANPHGESVGIRISTILSAYKLILFRFSGPYHCLFNATWWNSCTTFGDFYSLLPRTYDTRPGCPQSWGLSIFPSWEEAQGAEDENLSRGVEGSGFACSDDYVNRELLPPK